METGENIQALRKILDFLRFGSILLLLSHFYAASYETLSEENLNIILIDKLIFNFSEKSFMLNGITRSKCFILLLLLISLLGVKGKKDEKQTILPLCILTAGGLAFYFLSVFLLEIDANPATITSWYITTTSLGYVAILTGLSRISRIIKGKQKKDIFNDFNESFPQQEQLIVNQYSVNIPMEYTFQGKIRKGWLNWQNPFRGTICAGTPGSGKSLFVINTFIRQLVERQFTFGLYDLKFPEQTTILYNHLLKHAHKYPVKPSFHIINFDDLSRTHRCNVLFPDNMTDLTDATDAARTLMMALNRQWQSKEGDFFVESPIIFVTAIFWYLKKFAGGKYCTLPHAIELAQVDYFDLFEVLSMEREIEVFINPFCSALIRGAAEQLEGQIASAKISLARLVSPSLYYVLSGNDFSLDINNPQNPKVVCFGNNPSKVATYGAVLSLYVERMHKLVNKKHQRPCALIYDEFPTLTAQVDMLISTARSNLICVLLGIQDFSQLVRDYGKEKAEVIMNICGNIVSGQVLGESSKSLSERIGKINQEKESLSINTNDVSVSKSTQLESAIPVSRISNLTSGEFVGALADSPQQPVKNKAFHCKITMDFDALKKEQEAYKEIPIIRNVDDSVVMQNFYQIKADVQEIIQSEKDRINNNPMVKQLRAKQKKSPETASN
ncbi:conjugal transfer protein MobC [Paraflavitalea sp. CAU 1676]|uniref:conjugal transfer protein MobC n=1 Tax=Paraflavitalea sp. CAU 1676 TaxID=3032598 RepID=UPI0023DA9801|nr:conjugal transfer protein MobC [Paraflavitalea sp. CAU 1676]MDF2191359.1 conjugal transfer protein MobC [Paraflavitalea sp. CAU 1676]